MFEKSKDNLKRAIAAMLAAFSLLIPSSKAKGDTMEVPEFDDNEIINTYDPSEEYKEVFENVSMYPQSEEDYEKSSISEISFSEEELIRCIRYAHLFNRKVFSNAQLHTTTGIENITTFNDENLIIKGNNLLSLYSLRYLYIFIGVWISVMLYVFLFE